MKPRESHHLSFETPSITGLVLLTWPGFGCETIPTECFPACLFSTIYILPEFISSGHSTVKKSNNDIWDWDGPKIKDTLITLKFKVCLLFSYVTCVSFTLTPTDVTSKKKLASSNTKLKPSSYILPLDGISYIKCQGLRLALMSSDIFCRIS